MKLTAALKDALDSACQGVALPGFTDAIGALVEEADTPADAVQAVHTLGDAIVMACAQCEEALSDGPRD
jgi:hypothetical protein